LKCGEDVDWEFVEDGKGSKIVAKKAIPPHFRIMVEGSASQHHAGTTTLKPLDGTFKQKRLANAVECDDNVASMLCLRMGRVSHSCLPNASHVYDKTFEVSYDVMTVSYAIYFTVECIRRSTF